MQSVLIVGGGGMIGQRIARRLDAQGLAGRTVDRLTLFDRAFPAGAAGTADRIAGDVGNPAMAARLAQLRPDTVFHLAAVVSADAEANFTKGWGVNLHAMWTLLEAFRLEHLASGRLYRPRLVFASSIAVYGPPFDGPVTDRDICEPRTSYGAQKRASELLLCDFSRKGYVDGLSLRLPTVTVRPGKPNAAASSCFSSIIREPLANRTAALPISTSVRHAHASPRRAAGFFAHAATLDTSSLDERRALNMPSVSCTVEEQIETLRSVAGNGAVACIAKRPDPFIQRIVAGWPERIEAERAAALGFEADRSFREIVQAYIEDDFLPAEAETEDQT
ncbi:MAG: NAD-dependent epimerase/dehydratase family protein [Rhodobacteraceae bacterium]|nr:NAD-dependent epimerase/dehydratase family protein [Paracoccaceae bacterium]